jgi:hypothetical protein
MTLRLNIFDTVQRRIRKNKFLPVDTNLGKHWSGTDDKELYQKNLLIQPNDWYYRNHTVTYTLNSDGYRTHEFKDIDWANSVVIFGCSHIFGIGLDDKDTISSRLEEILNMPVINMGATGASMLFNLHNSMILRDGYPIPKAVVVFWPNYNRIVEYHKYTTQFHGVWNMEPNSLPNAWFKNDSHAIANAMFMSKAVKLLWQEKCPYYETTWDDNTQSVLKCDLLKSIPNDYARDMLHSGIASAISNAQTIATKLKL